MSRMWLMKQVIVNTLAIIAESAIPRINDGSSIQRVAVFLT